MRLSCPNCQTEYDVPDAALTGRARMLRCANCMTKWQAPALEMYREEPVAEPLAEPVAPEPAAAQQDVGDTAVIGEAPPATTADAAMAEEEAVQPPEPEPEPERISLFKPSRELPPAMAPRPASGRGLKISILLVVVVIAVVLLAHRPIGHVWPPSLRLFNALGL